MFEGLLMGTPTVTMPSAVLAGRFAKGILERVGLHKLVVQDQAQLVQRSVQIAREMSNDTSDALRKMYAQLGSEAMHDSAAVHEWSRFLLRAVQAAYLKL